MGRGKGSFFKWICPIVPGHILIEIQYFNNKQTINILTKIAKKLPIKTTIIRDL